MSSKRKAFYMFIRNQYKFDVNDYYWNAWVYCDTFALECYDNL